jgi:hypothetical protein
MSERTSQGSPHLTTGANPSIGTTHRSRRTTEPAATHPPTTDGSGR